MKEANFLSYTHKIFKIYQKIKNSTQNLSFIKSNEFYEQKKFMLLFYYLEKSLME